MFSRGWLGHLAGIVCVYHQGMAQVIEDKIMSIAQMACFFALGFASAALVAVVINSVSIFFDRD